MPDFAVTRTAAGDRVTLVLTGELDLAGIDELESAVAAIATSGSLVLDLTGLTFVDSSGLRIFMNLDRRSRREGWTLAVANPTGQVLRLLKLCGFDERLGILDPPER